MPSDDVFMEYVADQLDKVGNFRARRMFGEYALYVDEKVVALVCDNQLFVKITGAGRSMLGNAAEGSPYPGAKAYFLVTELLDDRDTICRLMVETANELPVPKPKKSRAAKKRE